MSMGKQNLFLIEERLSRISQDPLNQAHLLLFLDHQVGFREREREREKHKRNWKSLD